MYRSSLATVVGLIFHYACSYLFGTPLWTERIAEWIMAHTPSHYAVPLLQMFGAWAKPFAMTGGLATLGGALLAIGIITRSFPRWSIFVAAALAAAGMGSFFDYHSITGQVSFWLIGATVLAIRKMEDPVASVSGVGLPRRQAVLMTSATALVALESYLRNRTLAARASKPANLPPPPPPVDRANFAPGLVRKAVTPVGEFYGMSKNSVDPLIDPAVWRLKITENGRLLRQFSYQELLSLPRTGRFVTLRCVSNTLKSDLMGTAHWSGIHLGQLVDRARVSPSVKEVAMIGVDGHGDSVTPDYAFSPETMLALGMNGQTLSRDHGYPVRALVPRYYGFKNVKWLAEIAFVDEPYYGTWPKMGYTKEPVVHTMSHIDRYTRSNGKLQVGGAAFAGSRGIQEVQIRCGGGPWKNAILEEPLSPYTLTRWWAEWDGPVTGTLEVRARDGEGNWQATMETPLFPSGVQGPTRIVLS